MCCLDPQGRDESVKTYYIHLNLVNCGTGRIDMEDGDIVSPWGRIGIV